MGFLTENACVTLLIFISSLIIGLYLYFAWSYSYWKKRNVPYIEPTAFVGNFWEVLSMKRQIGIHLGELYKEKPSKYFGIWVFQRPHLILNDPELIKHILVKDFNAFCDRNITADHEADSVMSKALFMSKNPFWKAIRGKMTPFFSSSKIKRMQPLITEAAQGMVNYLNKQSENIDFVETKELCAKYSTQTITSCAFGLEANCYDDEDAPFRVLGRKMFEFSMETGFRTTCYFFASFLVKLLRIQFFSPSVYDFCRDIFWRTIKEREKMKIKRNDLIDMIIEMRKNGNVEGIEFEGDTVVAQPLHFFSAGFETTSSTMGFLLYELALNPHVQNKLRDEIITILEIHNGKVDLDSIKEMTYLEQVYKETLRLYPVFSFLDRKCMEDYEMPDGSNFVIEKGTPVYIPIHGIHRDPKYFSNPHIFDPDRFSPDNSSKIVPYSYLPFGDGPRNCIGERFANISGKTGIIYILKNFFIESNDKTPKFINFFNSGVMLESDVGLSVRFVPIM